MAVLLYSTESFSLVGPGCYSSSSSSFKELWFPPYFIYRILSKTKSAILPSYASSSTFFYIILNYKALSQPSLLSNSWDGIPGSWDLMCMFIFSEQISMFLSISQENSSCFLFAFSIFPFNSISLTVAILVTLIIRSTD